MARKGVMDKLQRFARRVGLGFRPDEELPVDGIQWIESQLDQPREFRGIASLSDPDQIEQWPTQYAFDIRQRYELGFAYRRQTKKHRNNSSLNAAEIRQKLRLWARENLPTRHDETRFFHRAIYADDQVRQRLLHFWANHFFVSLGHTDRGMLVADYMERALEAQLDGSFRDLLWNTTTSPAMTNYLDNIRSSGEKSDNVKWARQNKRQAGLNDNLARELLELHTVTPAYGYTEDEIRSVAKILAGWGMDVSGEGRDVKRMTRPDFAHPHLRHMAERGKIKVFDMALGSQFGTNEKALPKLIDYLARHPLTIKHLSTKLCQHFISDTPSAVDVEVVQDAWVETDGDLTAIHRAVLRRTWERIDETAKFQWPLTWFLQAVRSTGSSVIQGWEDVRSESSERYETRTRRITREIGQGFWLSDLQPNGFSQSSQDWMSPAHIERRLKLASMIANHGSPKMRPLQLVSSLGISSPVAEAVGSATPEAGWVILLCSPEMLEV